MWRQIHNEWINLSGTGKIAVIAMLLALLPGLILIINRLGVDFDTTAGPYHHMNMIFQLVQGKTLYAPLSTEYSCVTYTPLYWYLSAIPCKLFGMSFFWPRLVGLLASIGCEIILFLWTWRLTKRSLPLSVAATVIFISTNYFMYYWIIDINVHATLLFFTILGFYLLIKPTLRNTILAALALSAAVLTKQTALGFVVAAVVMLFFRERRRTIVFLVITIAVLGASFWYLEKYEGDFFLQTVTSNAGVPWMWKRIFTEVLQDFFFGSTGFILLFAFIYLLIDDQFDQQNFWRRIWKSEYIMTAAGIGIGIIASPKLGSGPTHCLAAVAGLSVCGMTGLYQLSKLIKPSCAERIYLGGALAQIAVMLLLAIPIYPSFLIDSYDREKNTNIANVFKAGHTCFFGVPYIQHQYGQPAAGIPDDEPTKWKNGKLTYAFIPNELTLPFKNQKFDYVIVGSYFDPNHPVVKAIRENYKTMLGRFPAHPKYPRMGDMRYDCYVLQANRLQPIPQTKKP